MLNNYELISLLNKNKNNLEFQIKYYKIYNLRNKVINLLIDSGVKIDKISPYILAGVLLSIINSSLGVNVSPIDVKTEFTNIETIHTENDKYIEKTFFDTNYHDKIEYSTAWMKNDDNFFSRIVTTYKLNNNFDFKSTPNIFSMSKEELEQIFKITDVEIITKDILDSNDEIYNNDSITLTSVSHDLNNVIITPTIATNNILNFLIFTVFTLINGKIYTICYSKLQRLQRIKREKKIKELKYKFRLISKKELDARRGIFDLMEQNLQMLEDDNNNLPNYQLRKKGSFYE